MKPSLVLCALAPIACLWAGNAAAAVSVFPGDACPDGGAVEAHLKHLGALVLLSQLGSAEVKTRETSLHVTFHDRRGESLGVRVVTVTSDCATRAALAAAVIAAFVGEWAQTKLANAVSPPPAIAPLVATRESQAAAIREPGVQEPATAPPTSPAARIWQAEVGAQAFGMHDSDAGGFGFGLRANLNRGVYMGSALVEGSLDREQPLGAGQGAYRFLRIGLGLGVHQEWPRVFWDTTVVPMVQRLSLEGRNVMAPQKATDWGFVLSGQTLLGWNRPRVRPLLFVGASYSIPGQRMTLTGTKVSVPLSSVNVEAGVGISWRILP